MNLHKTISFLQPFVPPGGRWAHIGANSCYTLSLAALIGPLGTLYVQAGRQNLIAANQKKQDLPFANIVPGSGNFYRSPGLSELDGVLITEYSRRRDETSLTLLHKGLNLLSETGSLLLVGEEGEVDSRRKNDITAQELKEGGEALDLEEADIVKKERALRLKNFYRILVLM